MSTKDIFGPMVLPMLLGGADIVAALAYINSKHSRGSLTGAAKVMTYAVLIAGILLLATSAMIISVLVTLRIIWR